MNNEFTVSQLQDYCYGVFFHPQFKEERKQAERVFSRITREKIMKAKSELKRKEKHLEAQAIEKELAEKAALATLEVDDFPGNSALSTELEDGDVELAPLGRSPDANMGQME